MKDFVRFDCTRCWKSIQILDSVVGPLGSPFLSVVRAFTTAIKRV